MIVIHPGGEMVHQRFDGAGVTGYVATAITINGDDAKQMLRLYEMRPAEFEKHLRQFAARFESNRA